MWGRGERVAEGVWLKEKDDRIKPCIRYQQIEIIAWGITSQLNLKTNLIEQKETITYCTQSSRVNQTRTGQSHRLHQF